MIQAIPTNYNGYQFRSQLEARWALFFDRICVPYIYELDGYKLANGLLWYRPDFWLPKHRFYVEVKPYSPNKIELDKAYHLALERQQHVMIVCGDPFGLLEVHRYSFYPMDRDTRSIVNILLKLPSESFSLLEHISEECIIFYDKGDFLHYYVGYDLDSLIHAFSKNDKVKFLTYFDLGYKDVEEDVIWGSIKDIIDLCPELSALVPDEALEARMHQFWKPRNA